MELGVFPVRMVEANSPKQVSSGNDNRYSNNESAASKADSGDSDAFSRHMRGNDEKTEHDHKKTSSDQDNAGEQKVKEPIGDNKVSKSADGASLDTSGDNKGFVAIEVAMKNDIPVKKGVMLAPLTKAPSIVGEFKLGSAMSGEASEKINNSKMLMAFAPKGNGTTEIGSSLLKTSEAVNGDIARPIEIKNAFALTSPVMLKNMSVAEAAAMAVKPGMVVSPINGMFAEGFAIPADLVHELPLEDLPKFETANLANFRTVKTTSLASQPTVNASLMTFAAGLDDFRSLMESGVDAKASIIGGTEGLPIMKSAMAPAVQAMAAAQPAAASAAAQLVAAIRTEAKSGNIEVRLDPPEMGRVRISLSVETADAVKAVLTVERPETLDHLRRNMGQFTEDLRLAGFTSVDVEFSENGGSSAFQDEAGSSEHDPFASFVPETTPNNIVYLSLRENVQLDLLV